jgi:UDP-3-O-[3-hydroxymyristoyl] N-acetylglucosamine deacetylase
VFRRTDLDPVVEIRADAALVSDTMLCTALVNEQGVRVSTIEHLSAALAGMGIDNLYIEVDAPEVPVMDGSSHPFIYLLQSGGIRELNALKRLCASSSRSGLKTATSGRSSGLIATASRWISTIDFQHPVFEGASQHLVLDFSGAAFVKELSRARTFGFMRDIEYLHSQNLALGGSLENAVVLDDYKVLNEDGLRYERVRQAQDAGRHRRPLHVQPQHPGRVPCLQDRPCPEQQPAACLAGQAGGLGNRDL